MKFITFIGTHCSGKTSYAINFMEQLQGSKLSEINRVRKDNTKLTTGQDFVALGHYEKGKCGGADGFGKLSKTKEFIANFDFSRERLIAEGILLIGKPMFDIYEDLRKRGVEIIIVYLEVSIENAYERLKKRNGGKQVGEGIKKKKYGYDRRIQSLRQEFPNFNYEFIDTVKEDIPTVIYHLINKYGNT